MKPASATRRGAKPVDLGGERRVEGLARGEAAVLDDARWRRRARAASREPRGVGLLLITAATGIPASSIACMLLPRPEIRTTIDMRRAV